MIYSRVESLLEEVFIATREDKRNIPTELSTALATRLNQDWIATIIKRIEQESAIWNLYINDLVTKLLGSVASAERLKIQIMELWTKAALQMEQKVAELHVICYLERKSWSKFILLVHPFRKFNISFDVTRLQTDTVDDFAKSFYSQVFDTFWTNLQALVTAEKLDQLQLLGWLKGFQMLYTWLPSRAVILKRMTITQVLLLLLYIYLTLPR
jgi:hypothetical protein